MGTFFQVGTLVSFIQGVYDGDCTFAELSQYGNCGLGTVNAVDGEMIAVDGVFYRMDASGVASRITQDACTPFAVVNHFVPTAGKAITAVNSLAELNQVLDAWLPSPNVFYMLRIEGRFASVHCRSESCQLKQYRPLCETLAALQHELLLHDVTGTLIVSRCPDYSQTLTFPGFHYHFINAERTAGGHVFDLQLIEAEVQINPLYEFTMRLTNTPEFATMHLDADVSAAIQAIETKKA